MITRLFIAAAIATGCAAPANNTPETEQSSAAPAATEAPANVASQTDATAKPRIVVHKDPNCGCCTKWVDHMRAHGFDVVTRDVSDLDAEKRRVGLPSQLASCHTGEVNGYVVEGHVPADLVHRLLRERPQIAGLAVPGMPMGSPGMEGPYSDRYDVVAFTRGGRTSVYASR